MGITYWADRFAGAHRTATSYHTDQRPAPPGDPPLDLEADALPGDDAVPQRSEIRDMLVRLDLGIDIVRLGLASSASAPSSRGSRSRSPRAPGQGKAADGKGGLPREYRGG